MKIIGTVESSEIIDKEGNVEDATYLGGSIVMLSRQETTLLIMLQDAWKGGVFRWPPPNNATPGDMEMSGIFKAIRVFVETKYAINEFKKAINSFDNLLKEGQRENDL